MKKRNIFILGIVLILVITISIILSLLVFNKSEYGTENDIIQYEEEIMEFSIIDMKNKENVEIVEDKKVNNSKILNSDHYVNKIEEGTVDNDIIVKNIYLIGDSIEDRTIFSGAIVNNKEEVIDYLYCIFVFRDGDGKDLYAVQHIEENIKSNESREFKWTISADFANAYDFEIKCRETE